MASNVSDPHPLQLPPTIIIEQKKSWWNWLAPVLLVLSVLMNILLLSSLGSYLGASSGPTEKYESGDVASPDKLALLEVSGTIMPPFTERTLKTIDVLQEDEAVKGVVLVVDSPGGLVADSHQIYHRLKQLSETKPIYVAMSRLAASGGYYVAMGGGPDGKIFVEPTTWTGSIGVIMPHYEVSGLGEKLGVESRPLTKGRFKDTLNPFRELTEPERELWDTILEDSYQRFQTVIVENRPGLNAAQVSELATGQIFTAEQALENGLADEVGYRQEVIDALAAKLGLTDPRVVRYQHPLTIAELVFAQASVPQPTSVWQSLLDSGVPQALYYFGGDPHFTQASAAVLP